MTEVMNTSQFEGSKANMVDEAPEKEEQPAEVKVIDEKQEEKDKVLKKRMEPLNELIYSEEGYVARLQIVKDSYIPAYGTSNELTTVYTGPPDPNEPPPDTTGPPVPEDLALRWRIVWGNWLQLYDWHSAFLEKLKRLITRDPERIPKLFIDSRAKLSSIYSKYCENHRKAALIAEQFREYFEELRIHVGDKQDVVSHLMQPVQRIMRYQLPMEVIVKYTRVADLPSLPTWQKALEIMKEIPKDTQLILEATMINNLPRVLTTLGKIHIRNNLMVACLSKSQFVDLINDVAKSIKSGRKLQPGAPLTAPVPSPILMADLSSAVQTSWVDDPLASFYGAASSLNSNSSSYAQCRFFPSRVFLFEKMLLITEEEAAKKRKNQQPSGEAFSQQTYTCSNSITVNNMKFEVRILRKPDLL
ncbi:hypothetical protein Ciccas_005599 [Cichlidogyrus casuarinus]|uniref:DH domain-containing protein n=1 Tax=Cichlidogyrus casuarinus TaxID=1844966 RepID=A0ABD2Q8F1_9PLAT